MGWKTRKDETGNKYTRLSVISFAHTSASGHAMWLCRCQCGNDCEVAGVDLRSGHVRSCGCSQQEIAADTMRKTVQPIAVAKMKRGKVLYPQAS